MWNAHNTGQRRKGRITKDSIDEVAKLAENVQVEHVQLVEAYSRCTLYGAIPGTEIAERARENHERNKRSTEDVL